MYVHTETGKAAWLRSQDEGGVTFSDGQHRHTVPAHEFFGAYREAKPAEIRAHDKPPAAPKAARKAPAAAAAPKPAAKPKAARKRAPAPKKAHPAPRAESAPMQQGAKATESPKPTVRVEPLT